MFAVLPVSKARTNKSYIFSDNLRIFSIYESGVLSKEYYAMTPYIVLHLMNICTCNKTMVEH